MKDMIKMVVVLTVLSSFSGGLLAYVRANTKERIEVQQLTFVKGPAIKAIMKGSSVDSIEKRFKIKDGDVERSFFVGVFDGKASAVAFETYGKGFAGDIGLMVGVNVADDKLIGVGVTTHSETPGLGSRAKTEPAFAEQFKGMSLNESFAVKTGGGKVDALGGATVTSVGVCLAASEASVVYKRLKPQIVEKLKGFTK